MKLFQSLCNVFFPHKCIMCQKLLQRHEIDFCGSCRVELPEIHSLKMKIPFLSDATALWYYERDVRSSLLRFKFLNRRSYAHTYARCLALKLRDRIKTFDVITWVPISPQRKWKRGYDQVELIALSLGEELERDPQPCLKKIRHNKPQSRVRGIAQRKANVMGVYKVLTPSELSGKRILLLDDIITTGATMSECAKTLLSAGAKEVCGAAVAAARPHYKNTTSR